MTVKILMERINNLALETDAVIRFGGPHSEAYLSGMQKSAFIFISMPKKLFLQASCSGKNKITVKRLMNFLKSCDEDMVVYDENGNEILFTCSLVNDNHMMWLETEQDADMVAEIQSRFNDAVEHSVDETEVYENMLESGINVDMVRKYMGDETADHMQDYCENHGLL